MAVVINEFEVVPETPKSGDQAANKQGAKGGAQAAQTPTDHEVKHMLERRLERLERVSAS